MISATAIRSVRLIALADLTGGYPLRVGVDTLVSGDVAVIQMSNVDSETGIDWPTVRRAALPTERSSSHLKPDDIIFTTRGTRNFAIALDHIPSPAVCSPHFFVIKIKAGAGVVPAFLAWQINQKPAQDHLRRSATGTDILNIRRDALENLVIAVPSYARQNAIVAFATAAAAERAAFARLVENRHQQMQALARDLHRQERPLS